MHPLQIIGCLITALAIVYLWVEFVGGYFAERRKKRGVKQYVETSSQLYSLPHEHAPIDPKDVKFHMLDAFDAARDELSHDGFTHLVDLENVTLSRALKTRTFMRYLVSADGQVVACCFQNPVPGERGHAVFVSYSSLLNNDEFFETSPDLGYAEWMKHPKWHLENHSIPTNDWQLLNIHRNRLRDHLKENADVEVNPIRSVDDLMALLRRHEQILKELIDERDVMVEHLQAVGADDEFIEAVKKRRSA